MVRALIFPPRSWTSFGSPSSRFFQVTNWNLALRNLDLAGKIMMSKAYEYPNTKELLKAFAKDLPTVSHWFNNRIDSPEEIVETAVGKETYRGLHYFDPGPKVVFTSWALNEIGTNSLRQAANLPDQAAYDKWLTEFTGRLRHYWRGSQNPPRGIEYGQGRKLTNLLMKKYVLWTDLGTLERGRLTKYLHVALDEYVLLGIRTCILEFPAHAVRIPTKPSMGAVTDEKMNRRIQAGLREIARQAEAPTIYLDVFFWNLSH